MALLRRLSQLRSLRPALRVADWGLAVAALAYGLWVQSVLWLAVGGLAVVLAIWSPLARVTDTLPQIIRRRPPPQHPRKD